MLWWWRILERGHLDTLVGKPGEACYICRNFLSNIPVSIIPADITDTGSVTATDTDTDTETTRFISFILILTDLIYYIWMPSVYMQFTLSASYLLFTYVYNTLYVIPIREAEVWQSCHKCLLFENTYNSFLYSVVEWLMLWYCIMLIFTFCYSYAV